MNKKKLLTFLIVQLRNIVELYFLFFHSNKQAQKLSEEEPMPMVDGTEF